MKTLSERHTKATEEQALERWPRWFGHTWLPGGEHTLKPEAGGKKMDSSEGDGVCRSEAEPK